MLEKRLSLTMKDALKNILEFGTFRHETTEFGSFWRPESNAAPHVRNDTMHALERRKLVKIDRGFSKITEIGKTVAAGLKNEEV